MSRKVALALLFLALPSAVVVQEPGVLHIRIVLLGTAQGLTPIRRHALLISDNPPSAPPRQVFTAQDGTVDVRLRPGNYTVESDRPVAFEGRAYQWTQFVDVLAGRDVVLELTADNADVETATATAVALFEGWRELHLDAGGEANGALIGHDEPVRVAHEPGRVSRRGVHTPTTLFSQRAASEEASSSSERRPALSRPMPHEMWLLFGLIR